MTSQHRSSSVGNTQSTPAGASGAHDHGPLSGLAGAARAERIEATGMHAFVTGAARVSQRDLGISTTRMGGGVVLAVAHDPTDFWSKTLGLGVSEPVTRALVGDVCRFYELSGARKATIQIAPGALPEDWSEIAADFGLVQEPSMLKLQRHVTDEQIDPVETEFEVQPVAEGQLRDWARVLVSTFGMPAAVDVFMIGADPSLCRRFAVLDRSTIIAAGMVVVDGDSAGLFAGSTVPSHRRRGAQSALITARVRAAVTAGAQWISSEVIPETPEEPNPSLHNLRRAGFVELYERPNWAWRPRG